MKALKGMILNYSNKKKTPYVAFIGSKKNKKFKYKYFKLTPDGHSIEEANGDDFFYYILFINPQTREAYKILAARIPYTPDQKQAIKDWAKKLSGKKSSWGSNKESSTNSQHANKGTSCYYVENIIEFDEELGSFHQYSGWVCFDDNEQFDPGNDGGGTGGCDYPGGGCDEEPDPNDPPGGPGGDSPDDDPEYCPPGQVEDVNGNCIDGETPCVGNPVKNPRIAEQNNSGVNGGREGYTRSGGTQFHSGLDIKNDIGNPWFAPFSGNIEAFGYDEDLGHHVTIRFQKNGVYFTIQFGHLQENSWPANGSSIEAGDLIGIQGLSGNLRNAIRTGATDDVHSHIIIRKRTGSGWDTGDDYGDPINPETFFSTKFDSNGSPITGTDC